LTTLLRWFKRLLVWAGPALVLLLAVAGGFLFWTVRSEPGTRWAIDTAVGQLGGQVGGVTGTLWNGVRIQDLKIDQPGVSVAVRGAHLQVDWAALGERRLHVVDVSAESVTVGLQDTAASTPDSGPVSIPVLPVSVAVDRVAVGRLDVLQNGKPIPVSVHDFASSLSLANGHAQVVLGNVGVQSDVARIKANGEVRLNALHAPWPVSAHLALNIQGHGKDSPLCVRQYVAALPQDVAVDSRAGSSMAGDDDAKSVDVKPGDAKPDDRKRIDAKPVDAKPGDAEPGDAEPVGDARASACSAQITITGEGDADQLDVSLSGQGQSITMTGQARLAPTAAFPLRRAALGVFLADGSSLQGTFDWSSAKQGAAAQDQVHGVLKAYKLDVGALAGPVLPASTLTATADFSARLHDQRALRAADVQIRFDKGSSWNHQPLSGKLDAKVTSGAVADQAARTESASVMPPLASLVLDAMDVDLTLGPNHVVAKGALGADENRLTLNAQMPSLADFWPSLSGRATVQGWVQGTLSHHKAKLDAAFTPPVKTDKKDAGKAGSAHGAKTVRAALAVEGAWGVPANGKTSGATEGKAAGNAAGGSVQEGAAREGAGQQWRGTVSALKVDYDDMGGRLVSPVTVTLTQPAAGQGWQWRVGATDIEVLLPLKQSFVIHNTAMRGDAKQWKAQGGIPRLTVSRALIAAVNKKFSSGPATKEQDTGSVHVNRPVRKKTRSVVFAADWDVTFNGALKGTAHIKRLSGDLWVPGEPGFPLGLQNLVVGLTATPKGESESVLGASVDISTARMGNLHAEGSVAIHTSGEQAWTLDTGVAQTLRVKADIADLGWVNLWLDDKTELGGALKVDVQARSTGKGKWATSGTIRGSGIKIIRIDDGVRLMDGTLEAHLDGSRLVLDSLRFPARLRVKPKEWRTATWVSENPDAKGGSLTLSGDWDLFASTGVVNVTLYRYPILQRSDRYAMFSGKIKVDARLPAISIVGDMTADAGWFNLDVLGSVPALDGDVVVIRPGEKQEVKVPSEITLDLKIDLGPRFYLTGYGVDSGLVGNMHILMSGNKLTGIGQLRTRGGAIDVYGQHLRLRRGTITFQGNITNPVLDIEALRTGLPVEAGVRVGGTAHKPKIDLVSYPDVSEVEKLSWLLLGRAPDAEGNDLGLLFSVGTSILGGGEPFYRKLGLDELGIRTGELGSTGSILPPQSVVSGINDDTSELGQQFAIASKHLGNGVTLSLEQALAATGTVGRASYKLSRRLRAELSVGTVNGIALVYHVFFKD
jgi:translocation and assembly module TamB